MITTEIKGLDELTKKLKGLSADLQAGAGRTAQMAAARVVQRQARANAEKIDDAKTPNKISKNVVARYNTRTSKSTADLSASVGVLGGASGLRSGEVSGKGKGNPGGDTFYWRWLEFGTRHLAARPFMRPAIESPTVQEKAVEKFVEAYDKAIDRRLKK